MGFNLVDGPVGVVLDDDVEPDFVL